MAAIYVILLSAFAWFAGSRARDWLVRRGYSGERALFLVWISGGIVAAGVIAVSLTKPLSSPPPSVGQASPNIGVGGTESGPPAPAPPPPYRPEGGTKAPDDSKKAGDSADSRKKAPDDEFKTGTSPTAKAAPPQSGNTADVQVFFGTDRESLEATRAVFANAPTVAPGKLTVGICDVSVPVRVHHIGVLERPTIYTLHVSDWFENANRHFVITARPILDPATFWSAFRQAVDKTNDRQVLLFIHGYNVSFDDAIYRTAQLAYDLQFPGAVALYSWPSDATTLRYVADRDHSLSTLAAFEKFLIGLSQQSGARTIQVIAHSMGNNSLVHALAELAQDRTIQQAPHFREIVMAAPDVDRREFQRLAAAFQSTADHITLYAADNDRAIGASDTLSGEPRVGDASPMFLQKGIDSIDASSVIKGFLKHSYFAESRILLDDIQRILESHASLPRFGLAGVPRDDRAEYWRFLR